MKIWIRRGYGAFIRVPNEPKARRLAAHWHRRHLGGSEHQVIGMFKAETVWDLLNGKATYTKLYPQDPA